MLAAAGRESGASSHCGGTGSHLTALLLSRHAWGELSATQIQAIAHAAVKDGLEHPAVQQLSKIGSSGLHPGNCKRDLLLHWPPAPLDKALVNVNISQQVRKGARLRIEDVATKVFLPHIWFKALYEDYHEFFKAFLVGGRDPAEFWGEMEGWEAYEQHSIKNSVAQSNVD